MESPSEPPFAPELVADQPPDLTIKESRMSNQAHVYVLTTTRNSQQPIVGVFGDALEAVRAAEGLYDGEVQQRMVGEASRDRGVVYAGHALAANALLEVCRFVVQTPQP